jgi:ankyrin repeat protein
MGCCLSAPQEAPPCVYPALILAAQKQDMELVKRLLAEQADPNVESSCACAHHHRLHHHTALVAAVWAGNESIIKLLADAGAKIDHVVTRRNLTPLHLVCQDDDDRAAVAQLLIDEGADVNVKDADGFTPLMIAIVSGNENIVKVLIDEGADVNAKEAKGFTPLMIAIVSGNENIVKVLLSSPKIDVNMGDGKEGALTPLKVAAGQGDPTMVRVLIDHARDLDVNASGGLGADKTPLTSALTYAPKGPGRDECIRLLTAAGGKTGIDAMGAKLEVATRSLAELSKRQTEMGKRERELALAPIAVVVAEPVAGNRV